MINIKDLIAPEQKEAVEAYISDILKKTDLQRGEGRHGVWTGRYVIHPLTGKKLPLHVAAYVLANYGTGISHFTLH